MAALGARVTATDCFDDVLSRLEETAALNEANFRVQHLHWGEMKEMMGREKGKEKEREEEMGREKEREEEMGKKEETQEELDKEKEKKMEAEDSSEIQSSRCDKYDLILGADITYDCNMATMEALLDLISSCSHDKTLTLLAHGVRSLEKSLLLWAMVKRRWANARLINSSGEAMEMPDSDACDACPVIIFSFGK